MLRLPISDSEFSILVDAIFFFSEIEESSLISKKRAVSIPLSIRKTAP